ncbi:DNA mismatch repair protein MutS [Planctomyces sp. SH-PL14]|uniref:DNA mismatch repair protein MutS n=1 Tax=Planctomyces sp. SH-PL14 TaxID=1632864 RepID=UPI00078D9E05|nr:DNA mismatch repair protein MutS [Planctomyces sp. SH-PL14]AMV21157.1 DNA mismatch repair protein MutS [Planctomyces sp. SH-PL14]
MSTVDPAKLTPMMQRYLEVKAETPGTILLFRMGDFYELFHEDAEIAARVLGLTLTSRDKGSANPVPMAGFPYHALEGYLHKLIAAGHKAAICEQVEDPKTAKGMVRREVTRIVTPGTLTDDALLDPKESNYLAAVIPMKESIGLAWMELSTGLFQCMDVGKVEAVRRKGDGKNAGRGSSAAEPSPLGLPAAALLDELARLRPSECLVAENLRQDPTILRLSELSGMVLTHRPAWCFSATQCLERLLKHFQTATLEGFDVETESPGVTAAGALLDYVQETQKASAGHVVRLEPYRRGANLLIDEATRRSLELTRTIRSNEREGSLLEAIDETSTAMGARLLADWLSNPLTDPAAIHRRLDAVEELTRDSALCRDLREQLQQAYDLQRLCARVATLRASPRDLAALGRTLGLLPRLKAKLIGRSSDLLRTLEVRLDLCGEIRGEIEAAIVDEAPLITSEGGMIRDGYSAPLDEFRDLARGGKKWIAEYQAQEIQRTGIHSLKVGFNKVFGYYLEVTAAHFEKVPVDYIRKQTLKNQERFITPALKEYEDKVLRAEERGIALENEIFSRLRDRVNAECRRLQQTAETLAQIDVLISLATLAVQQRYVRPRVVSEPVLDIREGRHPVLDKILKSGAFVPNDILLGVPRGPVAPGTGAPSPRRTLNIAAPSEPSAFSLPPSASPPPSPFIQLITGPNMAGKSTYIRQAALLTILAQMGSFIPASAATIGIADRIFARVGASDELGRGQSTFMVEMTEAARILNAASDRSLVILDEIGRGTSTYDGISLAWAITEYIHDELRCRTLFATHYHELTALPDSLPNAINWNVAVHEQGGELVFLHKIVPGAADRSYGIHVARLAGVPRHVIARADTILHQLENDHQDVTGKTTIPQRKRTSKHKQLVLFNPEEHPVVDEIRRLDITGWTPDQALEELQRLRNQVSK